MSKRKPNPFDFFREEDLREDAPETEDATAPVEPSTEEEPVPGEPGGAGGLPELDAIELTEDAAHLMARLEAERDEALAARKRALADYANFQRRAAENELRSRKRAAADVMRVLIPVLDHFELALEQEAEGASVEQFLAGMALVHDELVRALRSQGVEPIRPDIGEEFDPVAHEAMLRQPAEGVEPNQVSAVFQVGYRMGDLVLRAAKVAVGPEEEGAT